MSNHHFMKKVKKMAKRTKNKRKKIFSKDYPIGSDIWKYARMIEERRGHNYQHLNDELTHKLESKGYRFYKFDKGSDVTMSEYEAVEVAKDLRAMGYYARVVTGREMNQQRIKMYSVISRPKP